MSQIQTKQQQYFFWKFDSENFSDISEEMFTATYWQHKDAVIGQESGRGTTWFVKHHDHELVLRHYLRGGMIRHFSRDQYMFHGLKSTRSFAEFEILSHLRQHGFAVPQPAAAQVVRQGCLYRADLLTHKIPNAHDLVKILQEPQNSVFYQQLGEFIASLHKQGVYHADLNIQNILQDKQGKFWLIDFDRAQLRSANTHWQQANLKRLKRSFEKEKVRFGIKWLKMDWNSLIHGYNS
jgi:3-deoxy-D-manno-octulosonic acid kinase